MFELSCYHIGLDTLVPVWYTDCSIHIPRTESRDKSLFALKALVQICYKLVKALPKTNQLSKLLAEIAPRDKLINHSAVGHCWIDYSLWWSVCCFKAVSMLGQHLRCCPDIDTALATSPSELGYLHGLQYTWNLVMSTTKCISSYLICGK